MVLTRNNLNEVVFENEDARLLLLDVLSRTEVNIYYFHGFEITVKNALEIWNRAYENGTVRDRLPKSKRRIRRSQYTKEIAYR